MSEILLRGAIFCTCTLLFVWEWFNHGILLFKEWPGVFDLTIEAWHINKPRWEFVKKTCYFRVKEQFYKCKLFRTFAERFLSLDCKPQQRETSRRSRSSPPCLRRSAPRWRRPSRILRNRNWRILTIMMGTKTRFWKQQQRQQLQRQRQQKQTWK